MPVSLTGFRLYFGTSTESLDDTESLLVGVPFDADGDSGRGAVYIIFHDTAGLVESHQKLSDLAGDFTGFLANWNHLGSDVTSIGNLDDDGVTDIVIGAVGDSDGGFNLGAVYVVFLTQTGSAKSLQKISSVMGDFTATLWTQARFGTGCAGLGDVNNDQIPDVAVGAPNEPGQGYVRGAAFVIFLDSFGKVLSHQKIGDALGGFTGVLVDMDYFGHAVGGLGDVNGDGVADLVVGVKEDSDGGSDRGAVYIIFFDGFCRAITYAHSDYAETSVTGNTGDTVYVTCDAGFSGSGTVTCEATGNFTTVTCTGMWLYFVCYSSI